MGSPLLDSARVGLILHALPMLDENSNARGHPDDPKFGKSSDPDGTKRVRLADEDDIDYGRSDRASADFLRHAGNQIVRP